MKFNMKNGYTHNLIISIMEKNTIHNLGLVITILALFLQNVLVM